MNSKKIIIVGGGAAGIMLALQLSTNKNFSIHLFDANKAFARKFLVAGHGGFNLTHSETLTSFLQKYNHPFIQEAVSSFTNQATVECLNQLTIPTFIGSSGKVFPQKGIKPIQVLSAFVQELEKKGVFFYYEHQLVDFNNGQVQFNNKEKMVNHTYDAIVFALGGASWSITGSNGNWATVFSNKGIKTLPFQASNVGLEIVDWKSNLAGSVLKNVQLKIEDQYLFGEIELTDYGFEGAPIYAISSFVRKGCLSFSLNFKPSLSLSELVEKLAVFKGNRTEFLKSIKLSSAAIQLIKSFLTKEDFLNDTKLALAIVDLTFTIKSMRPIEEAISTVGGISMDEMSTDFELKKMPNHYCIGEMLDWDAPTGGYLLQGCFSMASVVANAITKKCNLNLFLVN